MQSPAFMAMMHCHNFLLEVEVIAAEGNRAGRGKPYPYGLVVPHQEWPLLSWLRMGRSALSIANVWKRL
jgi:hypothetical protein